MSEENSNGNSENNPGKLLISYQDLCDVKLEMPIGEHGVCDTNSFFSDYINAATLARQNGDIVSAKVYHLLSQVCSIVLDPTNPGDVWAPFCAFQNGERWPLPVDFAGEQSLVFAQIIEKIRNPILRARLADIAWTNHRGKNAASGKSAITAYCEAAKIQINENRSENNGQRAASMHFAVRFLRRAAQIAIFTTKPNARPEVLTETICSLRHVKNDDIMSYVHLTDILLSLHILDAKSAAKELEDAVGNVAATTYPMAVREALKSAAHLYLKSGDADAHQRCLLGCVDRTLAMRAQVKNSPSAEASWVMEALQLLRHVKGQEALEVELETELRILQKKSLRHMGKFEIDLEVNEIREEVVKRFSELSLPAALKNFALIASSRDMTELRAEALRQAKNAPLMAGMPVSHLDDRGRTVAISAGSWGTDDPDESWFRRMIGQSEGLRRARIVAGAIDPARIMINARFGISQRHLEPIVGHSPFFPETQQQIATLGFTRFFQGDFISAAHLLIPQLEPALRNLLEINGHDPSKRRDDNTEEDLSLNSLYLRFRAELDIILTPPICSELDFLFNVSPGPKIRHRLAHGLVDAADCYGSDIYYAIWLLYRINCAFLIPEWDAGVAADLSELE